jgi:hypothetical protein
MDGNFWIQYQGEVVKKLEKELLGWCLFGTMVDSVVRVICQSTHPAALLVYPRVGPVVVEVD